MSTGPVSATAAVLTCHMSTGHLHPHPHDWDSHLYNAGRGRLPPGTSLSGCGNTVIACELDNFSKIVSIGLPKNSWHLAVLHDQRITDCT